MSAEGNKNNNYNGITFLGALAIAFIVLRLTKVIDWPWLWVLSPLWIPPLIIFAVAIFIVWKKGK